jgi:hypothetical protein
VHRRAGQNKLKQCNGLYGKNRKKKLAVRSRKGRLWPGFRPSMEIDTQVEGE